MNELNEIYQLSNAEIVKITSYLNDIEPKLTIKQRKFVYFYVMNGFIGAYACKNAGYKVRKGKDEANFYRVVACQNLNKLNLKEAIKRITKHQIKDRSELEKELFDILWHRANYDIKTFQKNNGEFKELKDIPDEWSCCIDGTEIKYYGKECQQKVVVSKLADRDKAIDKLDKYIQFSKEVDFNKNTLTDETMQSLLNKLNGEK